MNDRFRFRGWYYNPKDKSDIYNNTMFYDAEDTYDCLGGNPPIMENNFWCILNSDYWTVEQCTGLKDKNGKLIYEGDLIKEPANSHNLKVIWENGAWQTEEYRKNGHREQLLYCLVNCYGVEIVGNIHENGELLK